MGTFYELVIKGDHRDLMPYLSGFAAAARAKGIFFAEEAGLHLKPLRERIQQHGEVHHVLCTEALRGAVHDALGKAAPRYKFEIKDERKIERATFYFKVETPSRQVAKAVKDAIAKPPRNVAITGYVPSETEDPSAKGSEGYAPAHDYSFKAEGTVDGDIGVIELRYKLSAIEFVHCDEIELHELPREPGAPGLRPS
jgi:hypothetical protein